MGIMVSKFVMSVQWSWSLKHCSSSGPAILWCFHFSVGDFSFRTTIDEARNFSFNGTLLPYLQHCVV